MMIKKIFILSICFLLVNCTIIGFDKGLNYEKISDYKYEYEKGSSYTASITEQKNGNHISIMFRQRSCGEYGLIGPLIFPIIPIWENGDCLEDVTIGIGSATEVHIIYKNKIYKPSGTSGNGYYYTFPLQTKSITDTAHLIVEKKDGEIFKIPFRYQHTFSFDLWPGR